MSVTLLLIIITCIISFTSFNNQKLVDQLIFYPPAVKRGQWYRFFSCGLIHADIGHLLFNMFALYVFGEGRVNTPYGPVYAGVEFQFVEVFGKMGKLVYLAMYILALGASLIPTYAKNKNNYYYKSLGASGAVSAVVFASILFRPLAGMGLFFIPIYIAGFLFGIIYLLVSNWMEKKGGDNINHSAHIFGAVFGLGFTIIVCMAFRDYPVLSLFVEQIKNMRPEDIIQFGGG
ncbi:MAG: rhomboid family intramembrane serine protease [Chitinophagaceae bacterium]|nr:rhomboid family intramembrane serine protease [Chitinophagaceae bacterium]